MLEGSRRVAVAGWGGSLRLVDESGVVEVMGHLVQYMVITIHMTVRSQMHKNGILKQK